MNLMHVPRPARAVIAPVALAISASVMLVAGCAQRLPPAVPPRVPAQVRPPDWFDQQLAAARAARLAHRPKADRAGAQRAYDEVMRAACTQAALSGPGKYPARCDAVLHQPPDQPLTDPCESNVEDPAMQTECSD
jgi:hypothetical protein